MKYNNYFTNGNKYSLSDGEKNLIISVSLYHRMDTILPYPETLTELTKRLMKMTYSNYAFLSRDSMILSCYKNLIIYKQVNRLSSILASYASSFVTMKERYHCIYEVDIDSYHNIDEVREQFQLYRMHLLPFAHIWYDNDKDIIIAETLPDQSRAEYEIFLSKYLIEQQNPY